METLPIDSGGRHDRTELDHILVVGHPIAKSVTPHFHRSVFRSLGLDWTVSLLDTTDPVHLQAAMAKPGFLGAAVSLPLKDSVAPLLDRLEKDARILGSVNTIFVRRIEDEVSGSKKSELVGGNSDWRGMQGCIAAASPAADRSGTFTVHGSGDGDVSNAAVVIGSGVLSSTAVYALVIGLGLRTIYLAGCPEEQVDFVKVMLEAAGYAEKTVVIRLTSVEQIATCDAIPRVVIHAARTAPAMGDSNGQRSHRIAQRLLTQKVLRSEPGILLDMAFNGKDETDLVTVARSAGWQTLSFVDFMAHQAIRQNAYWTGASPESFPSIDTCREILEENVER